MLKKLFSAYLAVSILAVLALPSSVFAVVGISPYMNFYDGNGIDTDYFVVGEEIYVNGYCPVLAEEGATDMAYVMPGGVDEGTSYDGNTRSFSVGGMMFDDVEVMSSAIAGDFIVAIDTDGSGDATASDCYSEMFTVNEYGFSTTNPFGKELNTYFTGDDVYIAGSCYPNEEYGVYITVNEEWTDSDEVVVSGDYSNTVSTDDDGNFPLTKIFTSLVTAAQYDVFLDRIGDGETTYSSEEDCVLGIDEVGFTVYEDTAWVKANLMEENPEARSLEYTAEEMSDLMMAFELKVTGDSGPILDAFNFTALGSGNESNLGTVELVWDENENGLMDEDENVVNSANFLADNGKLRMEKPEGEGDWILNLDETYSFLVFYNLDMDNFDDEDTFSLKLDSVDMRASNGDTLIDLQVKGSFPLVSEVLTLDIPVEDEVVLPPAVAIAPEFEDIAGHPYETYIEDLRLRGVVQGKEDGVYAPDDLLNRAEITKMASVAFDYVIPESVDEMPFPDVPTTKWYATYVTVAKTDGIVQGYPDGTFHPERNVARVEALKIVIESSTIDYSGAEAVSFPDTTDSWYNTYLNYAIKYDLADPYSSGEDAGLFKPGQFATRGEAAKMISQMMARVRAE